MGRRIFTLIETFALWIVVFAVQKPLFMIFYHDKLSGTLSVSDIFDVIYHGLSLDCSLSGYLSSITALMLIVSLWIKPKKLKPAILTYQAIASIIVSTAFAVNIGLYGYWGFPLDSTPLFYFLSSPADAMASMTIWMAAAGFITILLFATLIFLTFYWLLISYKHSGFNANKPKGNRIVPTTVMVLLTALLIIPIRGGITVSTANTGRAYFSDTALLNHAAVNPLFSFIESVSHQEDFASQYRFMSDSEANSIFATLTNTSSEGAEIKLNTKRPDIYLVILESFSMKLWETDAVPNLKRLSTEGLFFTNFYANSFRTDRGLVAILGGFPAQPTMSIMKYPKKTASLPSIAKHLTDNGYKLKYYYGGDADFTNMRSYLVGQGFKDIVSDVDFPIKDRLSKWGAPDDKVFNRLWSDIKTEKTKQPVFRVLQTSSSHEPFDVPYKRLADERLNAFAYTDDCVGKFVSNLRRGGKWENSLVIIVPDHQGCWPRGIDNHDLGHYHIPMIWTGGAVSSPEEIKTIGSQQDIAATLLGQLGIEHNDMIFSKDLLCPNIPHFAFFTVNDLFGMITANNTIIYENKSGKTAVDEGTVKGENLSKGKAYLQKLYDYISAL